MRSLDVTADLQVPRPQRHRHLLHLRRHRGHRYRARDGASCSSSCASRSRLDGPEAFSLPPSFRPARPQPFGVDDSDLSLDLFCAELRNEVRQRRSRRSRQRPTCSRVPTLEARCRTDERARARRSSTASRACRRRRTSGSSRCRAGGGELVGAEAGPQRRRRSRRVGALIFLLPSALLSYYNDSLVELSLAVWRRESSSENESGASEHDRDRAGLMERRSRTGSSSTAARFEFQLAVQCTLQPT